MFTYGPFSLKHMWGGCGIEISHVVCCAREEEKRGPSSGGFIANVGVKGSVFLGTQQQFLFRNWRLAMMKNARLIDLDFQIWKHLLLWLMQSLDTKCDSSFHDGPTTTKPHGGAWGELGKVEFHDSPTAYNTVYVGVKGAPEVSTVNAPQMISNIPSTEKVAEKPFLVEEDGKWFVYVPLIVSSRWENGCFHFLLVWCFKIKFCGYSKWWFKLLVISPIIHHYQNHFFLLTRQSGWRLAGALAEHLALPPSVLASMWAKPRTPGRFDFDIWWVW